MPLFIREKDGEQPFSVEGPLEGFLRICKNLPAGATELNLAKVTLYEVPAPATIDNSDGVRISFKFSFGGARLELALQQIRLDSGNLGVSLTLSIAGSPLQLGLGDLRAESVSSKNGFGKSLKLTGSANFVLPLVYQFNGQPLPFSLPFEKEFSHSIQDFTVLLPLPDGRRDWEFDDIPLAGLVAPKLAAFGWNGPGGGQLPGELIQGNVKLTKDALIFTDWGLKFGKPKPDIGEITLKLSEFRIDLRTYQLDAEEIGFEFQGEGDENTLDFGEFFRLTFQNVTGSWNLHEGSLTFNSPSKISLEAPYNFSNANTNSGFRFALVESKPGEVLALKRSGVSFKANITSKEAKLREGWQLKPLSSYQGETSFVRVQDSAVVEARFWASGRLPSLQDVEILGMFQVVQAGPQASPKFIASLEPRNLQKGALFSFDVFDWLEVEVDRTQLVLTYTDRAWNPTAKADLAARVKTEKLPAVRGFDGFQVPRAFQFSDFNLLEADLENGGIALSGDGQNPLKLSLLQNMVRMRLHQPHLSKKDGNVHLRFKRCEFDLDSPGTLSLKVTTGEVTLIAGRQFDLEFGSTIGLQCQFGGGNEFSGEASWKDTGQEFHIGVTGNLQLAGLNPIPGLLKVGAARKRSGQWAPLLAVYLEKDHNYSILSNLHLRRAGIGLGVNQALAGLEAKPNAENLLANINQLNPGRLENWRFVEEDGFYLAIVASLWMTAAPVENNVINPYVVWTLIHLDTDFTIAAAAKLWLFASLDFATKNIDSPALAGVVLFQPKQGTLQAIAESRPDPATQAGPLMSKVLSAGKLRISLFVSTRAVDYYLEKAAFQYEFLGVQCAYEASYRLAIYDRSLLLKARQAIAGSFAEEFGSSSRGFSCSADIKAELEYGALVGHTGLQAYGAISLQVRAQVRAWIRIKFLWCKKTFRISLGINLNIDGGMAFDNGDFGFKGRISISISICGYGLRISPSFEIRPQVVNNCKQAVASFERRLNEFKAAMLAPQDNPEPAKWLAIAGDGRTLYYPANDLAWDAIESTGATLEPSTLAGGNPPPGQVRIFTWKLSVPGLSPVELKRTEPATEPNQNNKEVPPRSRSEELMLLFDVAARRLEPIIVAGVIQDPRPFIGNRAYWNLEERFRWPEGAFPSTFRPLAEVEADGESDEFGDKIREWEHYSALASLEAELPETDELEEAVREARAMLLHELLDDLRSGQETLGLISAEPSSNQDFERSLSNEAWVDFENHFVPGPIAQRIVATASVDGPTSIQLCLPLKLEVTNFVGLQELLRKFEHFTLTRRHEGRTEEVVLTNQLYLSYRLVDLGGQRQALVNPFIFIDTLSVPLGTVLHYRLYPNLANGRPDPQQSISWDPFERLEIPPPVELLLAALDPSELKAGSLPKWTLYEHSASSGNGNGPLKEFKNGKSLEFHYQEREVGQRGFFEVDDLADVLEEPYNQSLNELRVSQKPHTPTDKLAVEPKPFMRTGFGYRFFYRRLNSRDLLTPLPIALGNQKDPRNARTVEWIEPIPATNAAAVPPARLSVLPLGDEKENLLRLHWVHNQKMQGGVRIEIEDLDESTLRYSLEREIYSTQAFQATHRNLSLPGTWQGVGEPTTEPGQTATFSQATDPWLQSSPALENYKISVENCFTVDKSDAMFAEALVPERLVLTIPGPAEKSPFGFFIWAQQRYFSDATFQGTPGIWLFSLAVRAQLLNLVVSEMEINGPPLTVFAELAKWHDLRVECQNKLREHRRQALEEINRQEADPLAFTEASKEAQLEITARQALLKVLELLDQLMARRALSVLSTATDGEVQGRNELAETYLKALQAVTDVGGATSEARKAVHKACVETLNSLQISSNGPNSFGGFVSQSLAIVFEQERVHGQRTVARATGLVTLLDTLEDSDRSEYALPKGWKLWKHPRHSLKTTREFGVPAQGEALGEDFFLSDNGSLSLNKKSQGYQRLLKYQVAPVPCQADEFLQGPEDGQVVNYFNLLERLGFAVEISATDDLGQPVEQALLQKLLERAWTRRRPDDQHRLALLLPRQSKLDGGSDGVRFPRLKLAVIPVGIEGRADLFTTRSIEGDAQPLRNLLSTYSRPTEITRFEIQPRGEHFLALPSEQGSCTLHWRCPDLWGHRYRVTLSYLDRYRPLRKRAELVEKGPIASTEVLVHPHPSALSQSDYDCQPFALAASDDINFSYLLPSLAARGLLNNIVQVRSAFRAVEVEYRYEVHPDILNWKGKAPGFPDLAKPPQSSRTSFIENSKEPLSGELFPYERHHHLPELPYLLRYQMVTAALYDTQHKPVAPDPAATEMVSRTPAYPRFHKPIFERVTRDDGTQFWQLSVHPPLLRDHLTSAELAKFQSVMNPEAEDYLNLPDPYLAYSLFVARDPKNPVLEFMFKFIPVKHPSFSGNSQDAKFYQVIGPRFQPGQGAIVDWLKEPSGSDTIWVFHGELANDTRMQEVEFYVIADRNGKQSEPVQIIPEGT